MKVLVVGSGGREHALCTSFCEWDLVSKVIVSPGNGGMKETLPELQVESVSATDIEGLLKLAKKENVDLTVVGPEVSLSMGIVDLFKEHGLLIVGPDKKGSMLETSKSFAKKIMQENGVPTAAYAEFFNADSALKYIEDTTLTKMVVKCDGLAQGKGVIVCASKNEARIAVLNLMKEGLLGENVDHIIIEEFLEGVEVSAFALCDGKTFSFLGTASDHKRLRDGDLGPNTGGMGVFSPAAIMTNEDTAWISEHIFKPMMKGFSFSGILFAGLMKTKEGWQVLEFNVRFGDPETQALLPLLNEDLVPWLKASAEGSIEELQKKTGQLSPQLKSMKAVHVVMAAHGYPGTEGVKVRSGDDISFTESFNLSPYDYLFMAGVEKKEGKLKTKGGRVLGLTSLAETYTFARAKAYDFVGLVHFEGAQYRNDIGKGLL